MALLKLLFCVSLVVIMALGLLGVAYGYTQTYYPTLLEQGMLATHAGLLLGLVGTSFVLGLVVGARRK